MLGTEAAGGGGSPQASVIQLPTMRCCVLAGGGESDRAAPRWALVPHHVDNTWAGEGLCVLPGPWPFQLVQAGEGPTALRGAPRKGVPGHAPEHSAGVHTAVRLLGPGPASGAFRTPCSLGPCCLQDTQGPCGHTPCTSLAPGWQNLGGGVQSELDKSLSRAPTPSTCPSATSQE